MGTAVETKVQDLIKVSTNEIRRGGGGGFLGGRSCVIAMFIVDFVCSYKRFEIICLKLNGEICGFTRTGVFVKPVAV